MITGSDASVGMSGKKATSLTGVEQLHLKVDSQHVIATVIIMIIIMIMICLYIIIISRCMDLPTSAHDFTCQYNKKIPKKGIRWCPPKLDYCRSPHLVMFSPRS